MNDVRQLLLDMVSTLPEDKLVSILDYANYVSIHKDEPSEIFTKNLNNEILLASESSLKKDCLSKEEDEAWADL
jgi:hypothetical protein